MESKIIVSKETTHVLGPLRDDGTVDFLAAINEEMGKGVTPENNAAIAFWAAIGPSHIPEDKRTTFYDALGIPELAENGTYLVSEEEFYKKHLGVEQLTELQIQQMDRELSDPLLVAYGRPWSASEFPLLTKWIDVNTSVLDRFVADSRRTRFYTPLYYNGSIDDPQSLFNIGGRSEVRHLAMLLLARASLVLKSGAADKAWDECLVVHRFARQLGQQPFFIDFMVATIVEDCAIVFEEVIAANAELGCEQARRFQADLDRLLPMPALAAVMDFGVRLYKLHEICCIARKPLAARASWAESYITGGEMLAGDNAVMKQAKEFAALVTDHRIDWNQVLHRVNEWHDRVADAYRQPNHQRRKAAFQPLQTELDTIRSSIWSRSTGASQSAGDRASSLAAGALISATAMSYEASGYFDERSAVRIDLAKLAFALSTYKRENGGYPVRLGDLAPKYIAHVPADRFSGGELKYQITDAGCFLYSVGANETDDGGSAGAFGEPPGDDIAIRVPRKPPDNSGPMP
jgi:hypothetical protein